MQRRHVLVTIAGLVLAGCQTAAPPPSLSVEQYTRYRIAEVQVTGVDNVRSWPEAVTAFIAETGQSPAAAKRIESAPVSQTPELKAYMGVRMKRMLEGEVHTELSGIFRGSEPARLVMKVQSLHVPSMVERVLVNQIATLTASIEVVEIRTGNVVLSFANQTASQYLLGGVAAPVASAMAGESDPA
jgi:hypothetical protein